MSGWDRVGGGGVRKGIEDVSNVRRKKKDDKNTICNITGQSECCILCLLYLLLCYLSINKRKVY